MKDFNPPTPCGVGHLFVGLSLYPVCISIHPPRVGWDQVKMSSSTVVPISIHPPRVGWDHLYAPTHLGISQFQSTHPVWGGTAVI